MTLPHDAAEPPWKRLLTGRGCRRRAWSRSCHHPRGMVESLLEIDRRIGLGDELEALTVHAGPAVTAGNDHRQPGELAADPIGELLAGYARQTEIGHQKIERAAVRQQFKRLFAGTDPRHEAPQLL